MLFLQAKQKNRQHMLRQKFYGPSTFIVVDVDDESNFIQFKVVRRKNRTEKCSQSNCIKIITGTIS